MHYRQPWVCAVEEELQIMKTRLEKCEEHKSLVVKLEAENQELKVSCLISLVYDLGYVSGILQNVDKCFKKFQAEVEKLIARVSELEYAA